MRLSDVARMEEQHSQLHERLLEVLHQTEHRATAYVIASGRHQRNTRNVPLLRRRSERGANEFHRIRDTTLLTGWIHTSLRPDHRGLTRATDTAHLPDHLVLQEASSKQQEEMDQRADERT